VGKLVGRELVEAEESRERVQEKKMTRKKSAGLVIILFGFCFSTG
jgi:hypothetical protein